MINFNERPTAKATVKLTEAKAPYIIISKDALSKMNVYIEQCTDEIGWLGTVSEFKDNGYYIDNVFLFDQEVHATTTEITPEGLASFAEELLQLDDGVEIWNSMRLWGHSHVNMGVSPSGQDDSQMRTFAGNGQDFFIRLIANKKGELKMDLYRFDLGIEYHDVRWAIEVTQEESDIQKQIDELQKYLDSISLNVTPTLETEIKAEMEVKVRKKTYRTTAYATPSYPGYQGYQGYQSPYLAAQEKKEEKKSTATTEKVNSKIEEDEFDDNFATYPASFYITRGINVDGVDFFDSKKEIIQELGVIFLVEIGYFANVLDVADALMDSGYYDMFTVTDLHRIWQTAIELANNEFDGEAYGITSMDDDEDDSTSYISDGRGGVIKI